MPNLKKPAIVIPARLHSTRLPNKALLDLCGKPMIVRVAEQAMHCQRVFPHLQVWVATDSREIEKVVKSADIPCFFSETAHACGTDRVAEVVRIFDLDPVINLQGDEPFIGVDDLGQVLSTMMRTHFDIATLAAPMHSQEEWLDTNVVKVLVDDLGSALYFSRAAVPYSRNNASYHIAKRHIGVYGFTQKAIFRFSEASLHPLEHSEGLEQLRALALGLKICVLPAADSSLFGINTETELAHARDRLFKEK